MRSPTRSRSAVGYGVSYPEVSLQVSVKVMLRASHAAPDVRLPRLHQSTTPIELAQ